jgi:NAD(P)-dependent dehydrogenase (short-subunit alcohol dehydrogenase family)
MTATTVAPVSRIGNVAPQALGTILITGGSSGLGAATATAVQAAGGTPLVLDRVQPAESVAYEHVELADSAAAAAAVDAAVEAAGGQLNGVFAAAGIDACGRLDEVSSEDWERVIRVNLLGTAAVVRAALPYLRLSHGRVVTCASTLGIKAVSDATAYCASKFGVVGFTRALAARLRARSASRCSFQAACIRTFSTAGPSSTSRRRMPYSTLRRMLPRPWSLP